MSLQFPLNLTIINLNHVLAPVQIPYTQTFLIKSSLKEKSANGKCNEKMCSHVSFEFTCFDNDKGNFQELLNFVTKKLILTSQPCQPKGLFPTNLISKRSFSGDLYSFKNKTGQTVDRFWLCYLLILKSVYCESCWLFSDCLEANWWIEKTRNQKGLSKLKIVLRIVDVTWTLTCSLQFCGHREDINTSIGQPEP